MKTILAILLTVLVFQDANAQDLNVYKKKQFIRGKDTLRYRILYPEKYKKRKIYPLILFLHGSGERGNNNESQLIHGGKLFAEANIRKHFKAIVIFPQCPKDSTWARNKKTNDPAERIFLPEETPPVAQQLVKQLLDSFTVNYLADDRKIYLGGLSMGAFGAYDLLCRYPDYFAAAFTICGATNIPAYINKAKEVPLWIFHGAQDKVVPNKSDRELFKALMTRDVKTVMYTEYPQAGHNSWDAAFAEPRLLPWLFSNKKKDQ